MSDDRALKAVGRIEQALDRIEAAATAQQPPTDNEELRRLREVHQALRGRVEGAISDIDRMLAARERV